MLQLKSQITDKNSNFDPFEHLFYAVRLSTTANVVTLRYYHSFIDEWKYEYIHTGATNTIVGTHF